MSIALDPNKVDEAERMVRVLREIADEEGSLDEKFGQKGLPIALSAIESMLKQARRG